jgi:CheY-like chemotaxis protein/tRNA A-37 threonylcarbamoyl transferase component Bud32
MARILIVEDDLDLCDRVVLWLTHEEHSLDAVHDGLEALEMLRSREYDIVILDWDLPGMLGVDVCNKFRAEGGTTPVLMLTGRGNMSDKEKGFDAGADDYLTKPFHLKELSARIKALVRRNSMIEVTKKVIAQTRPDIFYKLCPECGLSYSLNKEFCDDDREQLITEKLDPALGTVFGERYEIESVIGSGGMSVVYKAKHKLMNKVVAIKLMDPRLVRQQIAVRRFQLEAQAASRLNHPNVIVVHDFGITPDEQPYMVMDFLGGRSLQDILDERPQLDPPRAKRIFTQCASGLAHAHQFGVVHRDVKPNNIIIDQDHAGEEIVKIVDFGIAKLVSEADSKQQRLTRAGEFFGTSMYMSPEQCRGKDVDRRADIYSLGCVMFESLTGLPPFEGENDLDTIQMHLSAEPPTLRERRPDLNIPDEFEFLVRKSLEKDADKRFQTMEELIAELSRLAV